MSTALKKELHHSKTLRSHQAKSPEWCPFNMKIKTGYAAGFLGRKNKTPTCIRR
jgi:hypothetical protein